MSAAPQIRTALTENLKELHLPTMRECFEQAAHQAGKETLSYEQYLLQLTERDVADCIPADLPLRWTIDFQFLVSPTSMISDVVGPLGWIRRFLCAAVEVIAPHRITPFGGLTGDLRMPVFALSEEIAGEENGDYSGHGSGVFPNRSSIQPDG